MTSYKGLGTSKNDTPWRRPDFFSYELKGVQLKVLCDDKKTVYDLSIPVAGVLKPLPNNSQSIKIAGTIPRIIGVNLLKHHRFALYFDAWNEISYLEKV
ncbi:MAG: hypothetical protein NT038_02655 [Euryarchaeota archaeon]|nr:hypothetical protein [Euryarchaeota archaeon]